MTIHLKFETTESDVFTPFEVALKGVNEEFVNDIKNKDGRYFVKSKDLEINLGDLEIGNHTRKHLIQAITKKFTEEDYLIYFIGELHYEAEIEIIYKGSFDNLGRETFVCDELYDMLEDQYKKDYKATL